MCTEADIPLSKTDCPAVRNFLMKHVMNGGAIPKQSQLREKYVPELYEQEIQTLKNKLHQKPVAVIFDETPDPQGRCVLNILVAPLLLDENGKLNSFLIGTVFLKTVDHKSVSQAVVRALQEYGIDNENVIVINTDNAAYMIKAFDVCLSVLYPNAVHITCLAHIMNLVGESFRKPFKLLNDFMRSFSAVFFRAGARKRRYIDHLVANNVKPSVCPDPCGTRWGSWFHALLYHTTHIHLYPAFFSNEFALTKHPATSLEALQPNSTDYNFVKIQMAVVASKCKAILYLIDLFESNSPIATTVFDCMEDVAISLESSLQLSSEACCEFFGGSALKLVQQEEIIQQLKTASQSALDKLQKYLSDGQPGIHFLKAVRVFNPVKLFALSDEKKDFEAISGFEKVK